jgi:hypothetical protein
MKRILTILVILIVGWALAYHFLPPSEVSRQAVEQLSKATQFNLAGAGYAGTRTDGEHAFFTILHSRRAADLFAETFDRGTPEARLYALCGLHATDQSSYKTFAARFVKENQVVHVIGGCIASDRTPSEIVTNIDSGAIEDYIKLAKKDGLDK